MSLNLLSGDQAKIVPIAFANTPYAVDVHDDVVLVDTTGGAVVVNLPSTGPAGALADGLAYWIKDLGNATTNNVTINATGGKSIDAGTHATITVNYGRVKVMWSSAAGKWLVLEILGAAVA